MKQIVIAVGTVLALGIINVIFKAKSKSFKENILKTLVGAKKSKVKVLDEILTEHKDKLSTSRFLLFIFFILSVIFFVFAIMTSYGKIGGSLAGLFFVLFYCYIFVSASKKNKVTELEKLYEEEKKAEHQRKMDEIDNRALKLEGPIRKK